MKGAEDLDLEDGRGLEKHGGGRGGRASAWLHIGVRKQGWGACKDDSVVAG